MILLREMIKARKRMDGSYDVDELFAKYGVSPVALHDDYQRIPVDVYYKGCKESIDAAGDPILGLNMTLNILQQRDFDEFHFPWQQKLIEGAHFISGAMELSGRYSGLLRQDFTYEMVFGPVESKIIWHQHDDSFDHYHHVDGVMLLSLRVVKTFGGEGYTRLHLKHPCPEGYREAYEEAFGIPIHFEQEENCFFLNNAWWASELEPKDTGSFQDLIIAESELASVTEEHSLPEQIIFILRKSLYTGQVSLYRIAEEMGLNARTLQRRLKEASVVYKDLVDEARKLIAIDCLLSPVRTFTIEDIAFFTGYSDTRDFFRAFKRWMGMSPGEYREKTLKIVFPELEKLS